MNDEQILAHIAQQHGGLVEIYALDTTVRDWQRAVEFYAAEGRVTRFTKAGAATEIGVDDSTFDTPDGPSWTMALQVAGQTWTTAFPSADAIDLQGDPREITTTADLRTVTTLMNELHRITGKRVIFVPETLDPAGTTPYLVIN